MRLLLPLLLACGDAPPPAPTPAAPVAAPAPVAQGPRVVFLGDSLTAGYGLAADLAWPAVLSRQLVAQGLPIAMVNAGLSGDTSAGGLRRLDWLLQQKPDVLVLALGANDMLRGLPVADCKENLRQIAVRASAAGAKVVLAGMKANPTLGPEYEAAFNAIYPDLAAELQLPLVPFLLDGVAGVPALTQPDGLHPTAEGQEQIAALVLPVLAPVLRAIPTAPSR